MDRLVCEEGIAGVARLGVFVRPDRALAVVLLRAGVESCRAMPGGMRRDSGGNGGCCGSCCCCCCCCSLRLGVLDAIELSAAGMTGGKGGGGGCCLAALFTAVFRRASGDC